MKCERKFKTLEEFYDNISRGGEIEFIYNEKNYSITHPEGEIHVMEAYNNSSIVIYKRPQDVGEYLIEGKKIKEILNDMIITFRCF